MNECIAKETEQRKRKVMYEGKRKRAKIEAGQVSGGREGRNGR